MSMLIKVTYVNQKVQRWCEN